MTATQPDPGRRALTHVVQDALAVAEQLGHVLACEKTALIDQDLDAIERAIAAKHNAAADLETLEAQRRKLCQELLGSPTPAGETITQALDDPALWPRFCDALRACHEANAVNGRLVTLRRRHVRQALQVLTGHAGDDVATYGPQAQPAGAPASQVLGSA